MANEQFVQSAQVCGVERESVLPEGKKMYLASCDILLLGMPLPWGDDQGGEGGLSEGGGGDD